MSRCFPFPPPGYERSNFKASSSSLIESIKREEKKRRKEKKREKKERKKHEKQEKELPSVEIEKKSVNGDSEKNRLCHKEDGSCGDPKFLSYHSHKGDGFGGDPKFLDYHNHSHKGDGVRGDPKFLSYRKKGGNEVEQLERSGLTEEHGLYSSLPKLCDSSDSTQNSGKRKKHSSSLDESHNQKGSTMLRIRLPTLVKHKDPEQPINRELPSSSRRTEILTGKMADHGPSPSMMQSCCVSGRTDVPARDSCKAAAVATAPNPEAVLKVSKSKSRSDGKLSLREVIENWVPPSIQSCHTESDDLEWLFNSRQPKRCKVSDVASCHEVSSSWPRAQYLPEAEMYALPYTVPF